MIVIAFGHQKRVGKDTAAKFLATILRTTRPGINVVRIGFASKLKAVCYDLYAHLGLMDEQYYEEHTTLKEIILPIFGKSPRTVWIEVGNKMREVYGATWLEYPFTRIKTDVLIFNDLRYWNEAERVEHHHSIHPSNRGYNVKITNKNVIHTSDVADDNLLNFDRWNYEIKNDGTIGDLYKNIEQMIKDLKI